MVVLNALSDRNPLHFDVGVRDARHNGHQVRARRRVGGGGSILISPLHVPPECAPSTTLSSLIPGVATLHTLECARRVFSSALTLLGEVAGMGSTARIGRAHSDHARSASTETMPAISPSILLSVTTLPP